MQAVEWLALSRTARLLATHDAASAALRELIRPRGRRRRCENLQNVSTKQARASGHTVTLSLAELHTLLRASLPPAAHLAAGQTAHALLAIHLRYLLDQLALVGSTVPAATIAAGQLAADQLREWLTLNNVVALGPDDGADTDLRGRARHPAARASLRKVSDLAITTLLRPSESVFSARSVRHNRRVRQALLPLDSTEPEIAPYANRDVA